MAGYDAPTPIALGDADLFEGRFENMMCVTIVNGQVIKADDVEKR
jgi:hypothetical protein